MNDLSGAQTFLVMAVALLAYLFPSIIAMARKHHQGNAIFVVNFFMGWTALGWLAALVWALTAVKLELNKELTQACPACAETIMKAAKVCRFCGKDLKA